MTPQQIKDAYENDDPNMSTGQDVSRSTVTGLERGIVGIPAMFGNMRDAATHAAGFAMNRAFGGDKNTDADFQKVFDQLYRRGVPGPGGSTGSLVGNMPNSGTFDPTVQQVVGPYHTPQTVAGRWSERAAELAPTALLPGSAVTRAVNVAAPATTGQVAYELAPDGYKDAAGFLGTLGGGMGLGAGHAVIDAPTRAMRNGLAEMTPEQIAQAQHLALNSPIPLTTAEIAQQASGGAAAHLGHVQRFWENSLPGRERAAQFFADRPQQVQNANDALVDALSARPQSADVVGLRAQEAGQGALDQVRQGINTESAPHYEALRNERASGLVDALRDQPGQRAAYDAALARVRADPLLNAEIAHLPDNNLAVVNEVVKELDRSGTALAQTATNPAGNNYTAGLNSGSAATMRNIGNEMSDNWALAHAIQSAGRSTLLEPMEAGPLGQIARSPKLADQTGALFPARPWETQADQTSLAMRALQGQNEAIPGALMRAHLTEAMNNALKGTGGAPAEGAAGLNQYAGARYARDVAGSPFQRQTLDAATDVVNPDLNQQLADTMAAMSATGYRMRPGSPTAFNQEMLGDYTRSPVRSLTGLLDPLEWASKIDKFTGGLAYRGRMNQVGQMLTDPAVRARLLAEALRQRGMGSQSNVPAATAPAVLQLQDQQ